MAALQQKPRPCLLFSVCTEIISCSLLVAWSKQLEETAHNVDYQCCKWEVIQWCLTYQYVFTLCKDVSAASESFDGLKSTPMAKCCAHCQQLCCTAKTTVEPLYNRHHWEPKFCSYNSGASGIFPVGVVCIIGLSSTMWLCFQSFPLLYTGREGYAEASTTSNMQC